VRHSAGSGRKLMARRDADERGKVVRLACGAGTA
jgi:hypothetical protein